MFYKTSTDITDDNASLHGQRTGLLSGKRPAASTRLRRGIGAAAVMLGLLGLSPAQAFDEMNTETGTSGAASSQHSSQGQPTPSHSKRTADDAADNGAHYQQNEQPEARQQAKDNATRQVQKSLDGGEIGSQGGRHANTGQAKPTENWFGCPPSGSSKQNAQCDGK